MIRFLLGDERVEVDDVDPNTTVLDWLRASGRVGTKEGCASGDCGACTVTTVHLAEAPVDSAADTADLDYRPVNACIALLGSLDGCQLLTVEDLADPVTGDLHPVQRAMVDRHGSQCGFCTPGFVMSMFAWMHGEPTTDRHDVDTALSGNLCRCTGYRPIIAAARDVATARPTDRFDAAATTTAASLADLAETRADDAAASLAHGGRRWTAPRSLHEAITVLAEEPAATPVSGATDLALAITQDDRRFGTLVDLSRVPELHVLEVDEDRIVVGAAVPLVTAAPVLATHWPAVTELFERYGSVPIRSRATLGGNLSTASPIGDSPPLLLALDATVVVAGPDGRRRVAIDDFFVDYRRTVLAPGELVAAVEVPTPSDGWFLSVSKVSKRLDDDISAVCGMFHLALSDDVITDARVAFGGMAATPARARACEQALVGGRLDDATLEAARTALADDFSPIDDMRASAAYRTRVAGNLLERAVREARGEDRLRVTTAAT
ncbi:xanthine dehydrogenase small subunit [Salsipaludibacter albus]|uniref:xanthine dehydrogenase small subunit n=1 Tax=Salsipaludibacter albus TaxID=2849650 RepID=UPI001EE4075A|nr:xanthine dehydrogenase small subunit [Salsipaludibacter albus]MBY5162300.1 xanthine dehydrogenase small subunit [Salsipaludibacter albus]